MEPDSTGSDEARRWRGVFKLQRRGIGLRRLVHVDLVDGKRLTKRVDYPIGHAKNPLKDSEVEEKFFSLVEPAIGQKRAKKIVDLAWKLDGAANIDELMKALEMPQTK